MKKIIKLSFVVGSSMLLGACVATEKESSDILLSSCAIQQTIPGSKATGAFLTITKNTDVSLKLVAAKVPSVTNHVEIHEMTMKSGSMKMNKVEDYSLAKGENVFQKGGYHIMLMNVDKTLDVGEKHKITLMFDNGTAKSCQAEIKSVESLTPKSMKHMKHMKHNHS